MGGTYRNNDGVIENLSGGNIVDAALDKTSDHAISNAATATKFEEIEETRAYKTYNWDPNPDANNKTLAQLLAMMPDRSIVYISLAASSDSTAVQQKGFSQYSTVRLTRNNEWSQIVEIFSTNASLIGYWLGSKNVTDIPSMLSVHQKNRATPGETLTTGGMRYLGFTNSGSSMIEIHLTADKKAYSTKAYNISVPNIKYVYNGAFINAPTNVTIITVQNTDMIKLTINLSASKPASLSSVVCEVPLIKLTLT